MKIEKYQKFLGGAALSVIAAHTQISISNPNVLFSMGEKILSIVGVLGVPIFLVLSGISYGYNQLGIKDFFLKKIKQLAPPWIVYGIFNMLLSYISSGEKSAISLYNLFFGWVGVYYLINLIVFWILFFIIPHTKKMLVGTIICSFVFQIWCAVTEFNGISIYYNFIAWIGWFSIGLLINKMKVIVKWPSYKYLISSCLIGVCIVLKFGVNYASAWFIPFALICFCLIAKSAVQIVDSKVGSYFQVLGQNSMLIMFTNFYITIFLAKIIISITGMPGIIILCPILTSLCYFAAIIIARKIKIIAPLLNLLGVK